MKELLPVLLGFCFGDLSATVLGRSRYAAFAVGTTVCVALAAVFVSGEFRESWAYGLVDLLEGALGFAAGSVVALRSRTSAGRK